MLGYLPVIFFGAATPGPMHSVAILFWVLLFPEKPGQMTAFGFVQHNFFIFFNAGIGLLFLRRATRELFEKAPEHQTLAHRHQGAKNQHPDDEREHGLQEAQSHSDEDLHAERNEVQDAVVTAELALAESALPMNPVGIDDILGEGRRDQHRQDPRKGAAQGARKQAAGNEEKVGSVIEGPACRAHRTSRRAIGPSRRSVAIATTIATKAKAA